MSSYLITGTSRGLGLELVKVLLTKPTSEVGTIIATARSAAPPEALEEVIKASEGRAHFLQLDVLDEGSIEKAVQQASSILGEGRGLDVLINNAGLQGLPFQWATEMKGSDLARILTTNVTAVHNVSQAFVPLLRLGSDKKLVNVTSTLGSIAWSPRVKTSPHPAYKTSKAALNMLTSQYDNELGAEGFVVFCISPGWLRTDLGGPYADLSVDVGARATLDVIMSAKHGDGGRFRDIHVPGHERYPGTDAPW